MCCARVAAPQVFREVARVHPLMDKPVLEVATFVVRSRRRSGSAAGSSNAPSSAKEHVWELVQAAPYTWPLPGHLIKGHSVSKVCVRVHLATNAGGPPPPAHTHTA